MLHGFKIPEYNGSRYIYDEDQTPWMMLWSKPDSLDGEDYVVMIDSDDRVVVMAQDTFKSQFSFDDEYQPTLF